MAVYIETEKIYKAYLNGARYVLNERKELNRINVFPVADGDTGNNLASAMKAIIEKSCFNESIKSTLESIADTCLKGARGNSGIIFAQYLNGVSEEIENEDSVTIENFTNAHLKSVDYAYKAVNKPVEGTMLTVIKDWASSMFDFRDKASDFTDLLSHSYKKLEESLKNTKNQLSVLKKADVVDSGAKGFALFVKGIMDFLKNDKETEIKYIMETAHVYAGTNSHENPVYRYCVEVLTNGDQQFREKISKKLSSKGDSLVVAGNKRFTRIHIHTDEPAVVFAEAELESDIIEKKVDDMKKQAELLSNQKYRIGLVTDSIADLPQSVVDEYQIHIINLSIIIGEKEYYDKLTIDNKTLINYYRNGDEFPTSSQPSYDSVIKTFDNIIDKYDSIIVISVASLLSGTYSVFKKAAENYIENSCSITVIDSKQNSGSEGLVVSNAASMIAKGMDHDEIVKKVEIMSKQAKILVSVKDLETMIKGGRLGTKTGKFAEMLNLKPIVTLDKSGKGTIRGIAFSVDGTRKKLINEFNKANVTYGIMDYAIVHVNDLKSANELSLELEKLSGQKPLYIMEASSVIAISAGEGALALAFIKKVNK